MSRYLLTVSELARVLGWSRSHTNRAVKAPDFPLQPVPGLAVRQYRRADVEQWLGCPIDTDTKATA